ncbi:MAG: L-threonylcarbamoyladenylate synthase [Bacteroidales bacterium]
MLSEIEKALTVLQSGGIILYPTDTIWGIGCDATREDAVEKIFRLKRNHESTSMLILLGQESLLPRYVQSVPDIAWQLLEVADKPLTLIYPGGKNVADNLIANDGSIGIRIVKNPFCEALLSRFRKPIVSTSANLHGSAAPASFSEIAPEIVTGVDYAVDWHREIRSSGTASSIMKIENNGSFRIIRP